MAKGNPNPSNQFKQGNTVAADAYRWQYAVRRSVLRKIGAGRKQVVAIDALADALVDAGIAGDIAAIKEVGNRLDGQAVAITDHKHSGLTIVIQQGLADQSPNELVIEHQPIDSIEKIPSEDD